MNSEKKDGKVLAFVTAGAIGIFAALALAKCAGKADADTLVETGSAVAVNNNTLLTNRHVLQGCSYVVAHNDYQNNLKSSTAIISTDPNIDLGYVEYPAGTFSKNVMIDSDGSLNLGDSLYTLGYPSGYQMGNSVRYSAGTVSELTDSIEFLHTANIDNGSSGSGAFDGKTNALIGINTTLYRNHTSYGGAIKAAGAAFWLHMMNVPFTSYVKGNDYNQTQDDNVHSSFMVDCYKNDNEEGAQNQNQAVQDSDNAGGTLDYKSISVCAVAFKGTPNGSRWWPISGGHGAMIVYTLQEWANSSGHIGTLSTFNSRNQISANYQLDEEGQTAQIIKDTNGYPSMILPIRNDAHLRFVVIGFSPDKAPIYYNGRYVGVKSYLKEVYDNSSYYSNCGTIRVK